MDQTIDIFEFMIFIGILGVVGADHHSTLMISVAWIGTTPRQTTEVAPRRRY